MPRNRSRDLIRVGDRDGWVCGICRDPGRPVHRPLGAVIIVASDLILEGVPAGAQAGEPREDADLATRRYDPLAASIDHILPSSRGGTDDDGRARGIDATTGHPAHPYLLSVSASREALSNLDLTQVRPEARLKYLGARISPDPLGFQPAEPLEGFPPA